MKITRNFDMSRFSEYIKRPGIDPRTWVSLAIVAHDYTYNTNTQAYEFIADQNDIKKDKYGIYASVILIPGFTKALYPIAPAYAGKFGLIYMPLHPLDTVVVEFPDGALSNGLITKRRNTGTEQINPDQIDLTNAWIVLESGASVNVILPQGDVNIDANGKIDVKSHNNTITLASDGGGVQAVGRVNDKVYSDATDDATFWAWIVAVQAVCSALNLAAGKVVPPITMPSMPTSETGHISTGSSLVKAGG